MHVLKVKTSSWEKSQRSCTQSTGKGRWEENISRSFTWPDDFTEPVAGTNQGRCDDRLQTRSFTSIRVSLMLFTYRTCIEIWSRGNAGEPIIGFLRSIYFKFIIIFSSVSEKGAGERKTEETERNRQHSSWSNVIKDNELCEISNDHFGPNETKHLDYGRSNAKGTFWCQQGQVTELQADLSNRRLTWEASEEQTGSILTTRRRASWRNRSCIIEGIR